MGATGGSKDLLTEGGSLMTSRAWVGSSLLTPSKLVTSPSSILIDIHPVLVADNVHRHTADGTRITARRQEAPVIRISRAAAGLVTVASAQSV